MRRNKTSTSVWVLLSGGIDSTACVHFYKKNRSRLQAIFVDYRQQSALREWRAANDVARHYKISLSCFRWNGSKKGSGELLGRNAFLIFGGLLEIGNRPGILAGGFHSGTTYYDCSVGFARKSQEILDGYANGKLQLGVPFLKWTKKEIWEYCKAEHIPMGLTYSCERGKKQPCGICHSCKDLEILYDL
ncbi:MAG: 7-cyano-7-deazaguanine synthase [Sedimentisphaerales bacterium]